MDRKIHQSIKLINKQKRLNVRIFLLKEKQNIFFKKELKLINQQDVINKQQELISRQLKILNRHK